MKLISMKFFQEYMPTGDYLQIICSIIWYGWMKWICKLANNYFSGNYQQMNGRVWNKYICNVSNIYTYVPIMITNF